MLLPPGRPRSGDVVGFLRLYPSAPRMAPYMMDALLATLRSQMVATMLVAYRPTAVPLAHVADCLGMGSQSGSCEEVSGPLPRGIT